MIERDRLKEALQDLLPRIDWDTGEPLMEAGLLDSLDLLMIVARLHTEFQTEIPPQELTASNFNSLEAIGRLYERYEGKTRETKDRR